MYGISIKAIVLATLAVIGIDLLSQLMLVAVFGERLVNPTDAEIEAATAALYANRSFMTAVLIVGTVSTVVGGYLVARLAGRLPYFNALAFGVFGILLGLLMPSSDLPRWFIIMSVLLTIPAALLGAWLSKRHGAPQRG